MKIEFDISNRNKGKSDLVIIANDCSNFTRAISFLVLLFLLNELDCHYYKYSQNDPLRHN